jgi:hypothetical protein
MQVLESQLQTRRQRELELEQQVAELTARVAELSGAMHSAEAASKQSNHLERQVINRGHQMGTRPNLLQESIGFICTGQRDKGQSSVMIGASLCSSAYPARGNGQTGRRGEQESKPDRRLQCNAAPCR